MARALPPERSEGTAVATCGLPCCCSGCVVGGMVMALATPGGVLVVEPGHIPDAHLLGGHAAVASVVARFTIAGGSLLLADWHMLMNVPPPSAGQSQRQRRRLMSARQKRDHTHSSIMWA